MFFYVLTLSVKGKYLSSGGHSLDFCLAEIKNKGRMTFDYSEENW